MMMQKSELEIRYRAKVRFWWKKFEEIKNEIDQLQIINEKLTKRLEKVSYENTQIVIELAALKQESEEMTFSNIGLEE